MRGAELPGALSGLKGQRRRRRESGSGPGAAPAPIPAQSASTGSSRTGESRLAEGEMDGAAPANGEAAPPAGANQSKDGEEAVANQQRDEDSAAANGDAPLKGVSNEGRRSRDSTNQDAAPREVTNESEEPQAANENAGHKSLTNEDSRQKSPTNQDTTLQPPTNQDAASPATNQDTAPQHPANQDAPSQDPTNDLAPLPAAANQAPDPWDWSLEEAWLRAPEEEGLEMWGAELEDWGEELEGEEEEPGVEEVEPEDQGVESEGQGAGLESRRAEPAADESTDRWWLSPDGTWSKLIVRPGRGLARPGPGSLCRVLLTAPLSARWGAASPASGRGRWLTVLPGTAEGRWSDLVDAALETMTEGELSRLRPAGIAASITVRLGRFTPPPPFWTATSSSRWRSAASGHARASALLAQNRLHAAARAFSRALRAAILAAGPAPLSADAGGLKAELHAGLALAQLRLGLPAAAAANAGKALALRPAHLEARFRRGLAQAAMMDLEAAMADLGAVLRAQPGHAGARRELRRVRGAARERDARLARRLGRLFA